MRILVKYPTRSRPELCNKVLLDYYEKANNNDLIDYLISYDYDDKSMGSETILTPGPKANVLAVEGFSKNKIEACNTDINAVSKYIDWEVVLLISDDMHPQVQGWDDIIRGQMKKHFPDTDGCLWFHDGSTQKVISTLSCMGRKYYNRFGYIYHPSYKSFFCDNEYTEVAQRLGKIKFIDNVIIKHEHPQWGGGVSHDALYKENDKYWKEDQANYHLRKSLNFAI